MSDLLKQSEIPQEDDRSFEEMVESRDMIQEKISMGKGKIIELTLGQQVFKTKIERIESEIQLLNERITDSLKQQDEASAREEFDEAELLGMRIE